MGMVRLADSNVHCGKFGALVSDIFKVFDTVDMWIPAPALYENTQVSDGESDEERDQDNDHPGWG